MPKTFLHFAYGSNLLAQRIRINNPSAKRHGIGKLRDFRLDFGGYSARWRGAAATIVPDQGAYVWGAVWLIDVKDLPDLDRQEGVHSNMYFPLEVEVDVANACCGAVTYKCRVYQQSSAPDSAVDLSKLPAARRPSPVYLRTMQLGAEESKLPEDYRKLLATVPDNGYAGDVDISLTDTNN